MSEFGLDFGSVLRVCSSFVSINLSEETNCILSIVLCAVFEFVRESIKFNLLTMRDICCSRFYVL